MKTTQLLSRAASALLPALAISGAALLLLAGCGPPADSDAGSQVAPEEAELRITGFRAEISDGDQLGKVITADAAQMFTEQSKIELENVHVEFFDKQRKLESTLEASQGIYYTGDAKFRNMPRLKADLDLLGDEQRPVDWRKVDGSFARSAHFYHDAANDDIASSNPVTVYLVKDGKPLNFANKNGDFRVDR
ncbi:LPS export ABC transporter periplasmic protein LptC, partial [Candidatus Sumerlaeota bacterium]